MTRKKKPAVPSLPSPRATRESIDAGLRDWRALLNLGASADRHEFVRAAVRILRDEPFQDVGSNEMAEVMECLAILMEQRRKLETENTELRDRLGAIRDNFAALVPIVMDGPESNEPE